MLLPKFTLYRSGRNQYFVCTESDCTDIDIQYTETGCTESECTETCHVMKATHLRKTPNAVNSTSEYLKYRCVALRAMVPVKKRL